MLPNLQHKIKDLDSRLIELVKPIQVLKFLNWPDTLEETFGPAHQASCFLCGPRFHHY